MEPRETAAPDIETTDETASASEGGETSRKKTRTVASPAERVHDAIGDVEEQLGFVNYQLAKKDKSWITAEVADRIRQQLGAIANSVGSINSALEIYQPPKMYTMRRAFRADGSIGDAPSGMLAEALRREQAEERADEQRDG